MTAVLEPPLCSDLTTEHRRILQTIYDVWNKDVRWPRAPYIDSILDHEYSLDLLKLLPTIPERYVSFNRYSPSDAELRLTVAGMACCPGSAGEVQLFVRLLRLCVDREHAFRPTDPTKEETLSLSADDVKKEWSEAGGEASPRILEKAFALAEVEQIHSGWSSGRDPAIWSLTITRKIRRYRNAHTFDEYLAAKEELRRELQAQVPQFTAPSTLPPVGSSLMDGLSPPPAFVPTIEEDGIEERDHDERPVLQVDDLHELVATACRELFRTGHFRQGVYDAFLAFRDRVSELSGLNESDDSTLMGKAFGGTNPRLLVVPDLIDENNRNIQRGMSHLSQGLCALVRNPLAHKSAQLDRAEAMRMVAMIDLLVRRVEDRPRPQVSSAEVPSTTETS